MNYKNIGDVVAEEQGKAASKHLTAPKLNVTDATGVARISLNWSAQSGKLAKTLRDLDEALRLGNDASADAQRLALLRDSIELFGWLCRIVADIDRLHHQRIVHEPQLALAFQDAIGALAAAWKRRHDGLGEWDQEHLLAVARIFEPGRWRDLSLEDTHV